MKITLIIFSYLPVCGTHSFFASSILSFNFATDLEIQLVSLHKVCNITGVG